MLLVHIFFLVHTIIILYYIIFEHSGKKKNNQIHIFIPKKGESVESIFKI
jgi:hypothetical protein